MTAEISFVVVTDATATIAQVLAALRNQTICGAIELVVVCPDEGRLGLTPRDVEGLGVVQVVEVGDIVPLHEATAAGVRATGAPVVVIGETHAFPEAAALETVLRLFDDPTVGAVVPGLVNANPGHASWASLMVTYGPSLGGAARDVATISAHNAALRRELLAGLGDDLPFRLTIGGGLGELLRSNGYRLHYEPSVLYAHVNVARARSCVLDRFHSSRCYGTSRSRSWGGGRRALYVAASPLLPFVLGWRVRRSRGWAEHRASLGWRVWPSVILSVAGMAAGEAVAYATGAGNAYASVADYEIHRERHI